MAIQEVLLLRSFSRISFRSNSSTSSSSRNTNLLNDQDNQTQEVAPKHNLFDEEVRFEDINQNMDDWNIPEIPQDQLYVPETIKDKHNFDYIIKTVENNIPLGQDIGEEFHLLSKNSIYEHSRKYKYLHIGCVQVAIKPLIDMGIDATVLMCLRDIRHNQFEDSLIGTVETSLGQGPIYFNCYPNKTVSLMDRNILDSLFLNIHFHGLDMKEGSIPAALIYRIQVLLKPQKGETTLFITDMTKANVSLPRKIKWDEVNLLERWVMDKATPSILRPAPTIEHIKQDNSGKVEITFNTRNSFSSRIEASSIDKETLRKDFYSPENEPQRRWFFQHYKGTNRKQIQDKFYEFFERVKINVLFFDWFHAYAIRKDIDYPWKQDIIGDPTTNVITNWQVKDGELIQSELPPATQYQLPNIKDISEKAKRKIRELRKTKSLIEGVGDNHSELLNKIGSLLKVSPDTPQASENTSKMVTRSTSKLINVINEDSDQNSDNTTEIGSVSEKNINPINSKHWKTPSKLYYQRPTAPDLLLEERGENNFKSFSANNIYEWNIDAQTEYNIMNTLQHMTMVATAYQTSHECSEETIIDILVAGFSGQLKGWWDNYLTNEEKSKIYSAVKTDLNGKVITNDDDKEIPDAVNTLIFTIAQHFIGDPSLWKDRSAELLSNLKCRTLADFRWYRDTFLTRVYTREDSQQPFWKEKFLAGLPRSLGDKVRDKIRSQSANGDIPYESLSYGQLISYVQKVALKICQDDKIQRQLAKEKAQTKRDLGSLCEQFGLPACPKQKKKQSSKKEIHENKPKRFPRRRYSHKPSTSRGMENPKQKTKSKITCYNCGKQGHISKYCRLKKKLRNLNLEPAIEGQINNLLIETSEEETETSSSVLSDENLNLIQQDDQLSSTDDDDGQINTLTREQDLLFEAINSIPDPQEKKVFLEKLKKTLEVKPRQKDFITNNKFDAFKIVETDASDIGYGGILKQRVHGQDHNTSRAPQIHYLTTLPVNSYRKVVMPPKASGISLRGGMSTGKGARLALPEPTIKKSSTSSGSPTQAGSSTQKTNLEGSSTQIASIKPEPSTQESPKPATAKQTSADYAWPIETLQALQDMVSIKHFKDPKDQTLNTHSTIQILKVLQPRHFGSDLNKGKRFSVPFDPVGYTYWDYVDAWTKVFWHQNTRFKHSWLIYFKTNTIYNFPNWFLQWWDFFGPIPEIFPETVQQGFSQFKKQYNSQESRIPADLKYFSSFALSWIFSWQYRYSKTEKTNQYPSLQRHAFVKWWTQFDSSKADPEQVKLWFQSHPEFLKAADPETSVFLNQKSHLAAFLVGSTSKEVLAKNLKEVLQMLQQEEEASSSKKEETSSAEEDEEDPFYQNEDDCFAIKVPVKTTCLVTNSQIVPVKTTGNYRVENAHLSLKRLLQNSLGDICSVWEAMNNMMTLQHTQIKASFETSTHMVEHVFKVALYKKLLGMVSRYALNEIVVEYERVPYAGKNLSRCGCVIRTTHGLSYACELSKYVVGSIPLETTHIFLWRLNFSDQGFCETELDVCGKVHLKTKLREIAYNSMCPPPEKVKTKGAPKKPLIKQQKSTKCDPSYWEYDSIENIINVKTNDNCDYRAIAALLGIGEESWSLVHNHLHKDFTSWSEDISTCLVV
ncbi:polyprotein [Glycine soja]